MSKKVRASCFGFGFWHWMIVSTFSAKKDVMPSPILCPKNSTCFIPSLHFARLTVYGNLELELLTDYVIVISLL